jgi:hypothetical protein
MFRPPFDSWAVGESRMVRRIKDGKQQFPLESLFPIIWNWC